MLRMAKEQLLEWLKDYKQCIWLVFVVFMYQYISAPLMENADLMGSPLGVLEPYIGLSNNLLLQTVIPVFFLILLSGFPEKYGTSYFSAVRIGRERWLSVQIVFLIFCCLAFSAMAFLISVLTAAGHISVQWEWSSVLTEFGEKFPELSSNYGNSILDERTYFQGQPPETAAWSFFLMNLHLFVLGMLQLTAYCTGIGRAGYVSSILTEAMGLLLCAAESPAKWIFPLSHGMFSTHFTKYYADEIVPVSYSILYFGGFLLIFYIACSLGIKKVSMTGGEGKV